MKEKIAELLCVVIGSKISKIEGAEIKTDQILSLLKGEIGKIKNPYPEDTGVEEYRFGFWLAIQAILQALES